MIPGQALAMSQLSLATMAVLAAVAIAGEEEGVGDLAAETAGNMDELDESNDCRFWQRETFASNVVAGVGFDDFGFPFDH